MKVKPKQTKENTYELDYKNVDWNRRYDDPIIRWLWDNKTRVTPANRERGIFKGVIHWPNGHDQPFEVNRT